MNSLSVCVSLLALFGCAAATSLWTRAFDPDTVERPIEEYREAYRRHLLERRQEVKCTEADTKACGPAPTTDWELVVEGKENTKCLAVGKHATEPVWWVPDPAKPCCKFHGCVVGDCAKLGAEFPNKKGAKCTENDKEDGTETDCKERVKRKTCGCNVEVCENKACAASVKCPECLTLTSKVNHCGCLTEKESCQPVTPPRPVCEVAADCKNCTECDVTKKVLGDKCATKYKALDKHVCVPVECKPNEECNACQVPRVVTSKGGCCNQIKCDDIKEPSSGVCKAPNKKGECASACEEVVEKPLTSNAACKKTVKCCVPKKCAPPAPKECAECELKETVTNACGCLEHKCKEIPEIAMCKLPVKYLLSVKTGDENNPALAASTGFAALSADEKKKIPHTTAGATVKITGACTPEQLVDPKAPKKECTVIIPKGQLGITSKKVAVEGKKCENIGLVEKVEVTLTDDDIWFVEEIKIETPNDPNSKPTVVKVNKFLGNVKPSHPKWTTLGPWKTKEEVVTNLVEGLKCDAKCEHVKMLNDHECKPMRNGTCEANACPATPKCGKCDYQFPTEEECSCAGNICVPTYTPEEAKELCPEGTIPKRVIDVAGERPDECQKPPKNIICEKPPICDEVCPPEPEDVTCSQCEQAVLAEKIVVGNAEDGPCVCLLNVCEPREQCQTKEEAEEELSCPACMEAVETGEVLPCGCKKWECGPKGLTGCSEECDPCSECKQGFSKECEMPMFQCLPKTCPGKKACQVPDEVNGEPKLDECNCEIFKNKPCINDPVNACEPGKFRVEEGQDACGCGTKIAVPCEQTAPPTCNTTCHALKEESDGCCKSWTCEKKPCPAVPKPECPKCHTITVHDDECHCCKSTCERAPCPPVKRCPAGEKPTVVRDECGCMVLVKCTPEGGVVITCPKDKKCKKPVTPVELCTKCED